MLITRREDGIYTSGLVLTTINGMLRFVSTQPYVGKTVAEVIAQAVGNAYVRHWRVSLSQKLRVSVVK